MSTSSVERPAQDPLCREGHRWKIRLQIESCNCVPIWICILFVFVKIKQKVQIIRFLLNDDFMGKPSMTQYFIVF